MQSVIDLIDCFPATQFASTVLDCQNKVSDFKCAIILMTAFELAWTKQQHEHTIRLQEKPMCNTPHRNVTNLPWIAFELHRQQHIPADAAPPPKKKNPLKCSKNKSLFLRFQSSCLVNSWPLSQDCLACSRWYQCINQRTLKWDTEGCKGSTVPNWSMACSRN